MLNQYLCDRYLLIKELSKKANRRTFLATDTHCPSPVIIKIIQFGSAVQWADLKLFEREAKILKHLHHSSIPQYKDSFETEIEGVPSFVLVQAYIEAPSLETMAQLGTRLCEAEIVDIAKQLLNTLIYLHRQLPPVIHRDIKPSNILISRPSPRATANVEGVLERKVYLVDFGAVQIAASKTSGTVTVVGSYGYMPLEQFVGQTTPASDLYSLGMTLLYLATGAHPADMPQVEGQIPVKEMALSFELSEPFSRWLARMTQPYLDRRFESAAIALDSLMAGLTNPTEATGYYPHLKPAVRSFNIYRQRNKLEIVSELTSLFSSHRYAIISISRTEGIRAGTFRSKHPADRRSVKWKQPQSPYQSIGLLAYTPGHTFKRHYEQNKQTYADSGIALPPKLSIHAGSHEYSLYPRRKLSEAEQRWLDAELSDFLGRSLQIIRPQERDSNAQPQLAEYNIRRLP